jgi:oligoribonuclease NrnB/cAMP/cGMP phosphodiesterase (DHH superfamily)
MFVQDRDLWRFKLAKSKEYAVALFSYEYTFENWDKISKWPTTRMTEEGASLLRKHNKDIAEFIKANKRRRMTIAGHNVPVINVPYTLGSDACHILAQGEPFAAYYYDLGDDRMFGLRSAEDGEDVSKIAGHYGGGGHKHAAGFKLEGFNIDFNEL